MLGSGFDPGVTNVFTSYAKKHLLDKIKTLDILDCNAGSHGKAFATNFNPEINIREVQQPARHYNNNQWVETPAVIDEGSVHFGFDYPVVGKKESYLLYHEELESLVKHFPEIEKARFWMTFGEQYLNHLRVLRNVGMTRVDSVEVDNQKVIPLKVLAAVLPKPETLGEGYSGKTVIGNVMTGIKNGKERSIYIYNVCDHAECYNEVRSQAISYTTGVPAMIGAKMLMTGKWKGEGVFNIEQMNPDPFMSDLNKYGLPWRLEEFKGKISN